MPTYDYLCEGNGRVVEVCHGMHERLATWGELCRCAGIVAGDTPLASPVSRLITGGAVVGRAPADAAGAAHCEPATCCGGLCRTS